jgi:hypothetical protein
MCPTIVRMVKLGDYVEEDKKWTEKSLVKSSSQIPRKEMRE